MPFQTPPTPNFGTRTALEVESNSGTEGGFFQIKSGVKMEEKGMREEDHGREKGDIRERRGLWEGGEDYGKETGGPWEGGEGHGEERRGAWEGREEPGKREGPWERGEDLGGWRASLRRRKDCSVGTGFEGRPYFESLIFMSYRLSAPSCQTTNPQTQRTSELDFAWGSRPGSLLKHSWGQVGPRTGKRSVGRAQATSELVLLARGVLGNRRGT